MVAVYTQDQTSRTGAPVYKMQFQKTFEMTQRFQEGKNMKNSYSTSSQSPIHPLPPRLPLMLQN